MKPVHMVMVFRSNTYTLTALFLRTSTLILLLAWINAYAHGPVPRFLLYLTGFMLLREVCRLLASIAYAPNEAAVLSVAIRGSFPSAPAVRPAHLSKLIHKGSLVLRGENHSVLQATVSPPYRLRGLKQGRTIRIAYHPGDYGLQEFDGIMHSLSHLPSVAAAIKAIRLREKEMPKKNEIDTPLGTPSVPQLKNPIPIASLLWHSFTDGLKAGARPTAH